MTHMIRDKEYPHRIWVERDEETNEKRWFSCKGMGVEYVRADLAPSVIPPKPEADRDR